MYRSGRDRGGGKYKCDVGGVFAVVVTFFLDFPPQDWSQKVVVLLFFLLLFFVFFFC